MGIFVQTRRESQTDAWQCDVSKSASLKCNIIVSNVVCGNLVLFYFILSFDYRAVFAPACLSHEVLLKK